MSGYAKLFASIVESSLWDEDSNTCKVWITLLALADSEGFIRGSVGWLSKRARVDAVTVEKALRKFQDPDPFSRTPTKEGRRLETTPDGWVIINYAWYREQDGKELSKDSRRTYQRDWMRKKRAELDLSTGVNTSQQVSTGVNTCQHSASASASVDGIGVQGEGVKIPSWVEWWGICQIVGIPEWKAQDEFDRQATRDDPWSGARGNLRIHATRVKKWWERDGRHLTPPTKDQLNGKPSPVDVSQIYFNKRIDRIMREAKNIGTDLPD